MNSTIDWAVKNPGSVAHLEKLVLRVKCEIVPIATSLREVGMLLLGIFQECDAPRFANRSGKAGS